MSDDPEPKVLRCDLTERQKEQIAKLRPIEKQPRAEKRAFKEAFEVSEALLNLEEKLSDPHLSKSARAAYEKERRELENQITPSFDRAVLERNRPIVEAYLRQSGEQPDKLRCTREFMESLPAINRGGRQVKASSRVAKRVFRKTFPETFDIKGKPGRPKKPKSM
jgi:hypothetical protein